MSTSAPWFAVCADWVESPMWDDLEKPLHPGHELRDSIRLAWLCLLAEAKQLGRAGVVRIRPGPFARKYALAGGVEAVEIMLDLASQPQPDGAAAITREGDRVTLAAWKQYQDPACRTRKAANATTKTANKQENRAKDAGTSKTPQRGDNLQTSNGFTKSAATHHTSQLPTTTSEIESEGAEADSLDGGDGEGLSPEAFGRLASADLASCSPARCLELMGVEPAGARSLAERFGERRIREVCGWVRQRIVCPPEDQEAIRNPGGLVNAILRTRSRLSDLTPAGATAMRIEGARASRREARR